ncbi:MAG: hypothetical protein ACTSX6_02190 [Candidatus Heimdallarchaeaceae archaeon]
MNQLQEIKILFKKRIEQLERKKQTCLDYSSTPNRCVAKVQAQIERTKKLARVARFRTKALESETVLNSYLDLLQEGRPKSPVGRAVSYGLTGLGVYKGTRWAIRRSECKQYKYSPYLHKRCMKGIEENKNVKIY